MNLKTVTKLIFLLTLTILASCVKNNDEVKTKPSPEKVELTFKNIAGSWEIYFYTKSVVDAKTNVKSQYRFTEEDGYSVTFLEDGTYYENNVFGHRNISGKYLIGDFDADDKDKIWEIGPLPGKKKNGVFMTYKTLKTKVDTTMRAEIPELYSDHFAYRDRYWGTTKDGKTTFLVEDIKYLRNLKKAPNYMPEGKEFYKNNIDIQQLLGRWEFYNQFVIINGVRHEATDSVKAQFNRLYTVFKIENGLNIFEEYIIKQNKETLKDETVLNRNGEFKVIDDVVHMYNIYTDPNTKEKVVESFKLWIKEPIGNNNDGYRMIRSYDRTKDVNDVFKEIEEFDYFRRVADK